MLHRTSECELEIHDDMIEHDRGVSIEVQEQDCYRVRRLHAEGFEPRTIVDIGAHIGTFAMMADKYFPRATVYAFEPIRRHYDLLRRNAPRCVAHDAAVLGFLGDEAGREIYPSNSFEQGLRGRRASEEGALVQCMSVGEIGAVRAVSCREMLDLVGGRAIDMLKIDCEEGEVNIFRELESLDRIRDIPIITGEWHFATAKREIREKLSRTHDLELVDEGDWNHFFARKR